MGTDIKIKIITEIILEGCKVEGQKVNRYLFLNNAKLKILFNYE